MDRRNFLKNSLMAGTAIAAGSTGGTVTGKNPDRADLLTRHAFKLNYAPHFGMFSNHAGSDLIDQLKFMNDLGFRAFEDNGMKGRSIRIQERIGQHLADTGMTMGVFVAHTIHWSQPSLSSGDSGYLDQFLSEIRESVDVARRVNARWMTVVPGFVTLNLDMDYQELNVINALKQASEILEPYNLTMVLEPLNRLRDHPGMVLYKTSQAFRICKHVNSPACKILYDAYHQAITEGNMIPNMDAAWDEISYIQLGDHPGRKEPFTGEINYRNIFKYLHGKGFTGVVGMEHGKSEEGKEGELKLIEAYLKADDFEV
jgi:hydroxypyruvate isomerase